MPQPIRHPDIVPVNFRPDAILHRPHLAAHIVVISNIWNDIESRIGLFLATLLEADVRTTVSMYLAITNDGAKRAALDAVARLKLSSIDQAALQTALAQAGIAYAERNKAVHGSWGIADKYPHDLLRGDPKDAILFHADMMKFKPDDNDPRHARIMEYQKLIFRFNETDFLSIEAKMDSIATEIYAFTNPFINKAYGTDTLVLPTRPIQPQRGKQKPPDPSGGQNGAQ